VASSSSRANWLLSRSPGAGGAPFPGQLGRGERSSEPHGMPLPRCCWKPAGKGQSGELRGERAALAVGRVLGRDGCLDPATPTTPITPFPAVLPPQTCCFGAQPGSWKNRAGGAAERCGKVSANKNLRNPSAFPTDPPAASQATAVQRGGHPAPGVRQLGPGGTPGCGEVMQQLGVPQLCSRDCLSP